MIVPDDEPFRSNTLGAYNIIESQTSTSCISDTLVGPEEYNEQTFYSYVHEPAQWKVHRWSHAIWEECVRLRCRRLG